MHKYFLMLALFSTTVFAQSEAALQESLMKMMQQAKQAQQCMQGVDMSKLDGMEKEGRVMESEVKALCASGKRDMAQQKALAYSKEIMSRPYIQKIRECGEMMSGVMPQMPFDHVEENAQNKHICDEL